MRVNVLIWDSSFSGPIYEREEVVEYAKLLWDEGKKDKEIIEDLRTNGGLSLGKAHFVLKHLQANYPR